MAEPSAQAPGARRPRPGLGSPSAALEERGASELVEVARAFNTMHERIDRYLNERGQLFSAISHDLRTPITRLRLRVELLEDERLQESSGATWTSWNCW